MEYQTGGLFMEHEREIELVGSIDGCKHSGNNETIIEAISKGVSDALRSSITKTTIKLDGGKLDASQIQSFTEVDSIRN